MAMTKKEFKRLKEAGVISKKAKWKNYKDDR